MPTIDPSLIADQIAELEADILFCDSETEAQPLRDMIAYLTQKRRLAELGIE